MISGRDGASFNAWIGRWEINGDGSDGFVSGRHTRRSVAIQTAEGGGAVIRADNARRGGHVASLVVVLAGGRRHRVNPGGTWEQKDLAMLITKIVLECINIY